MILGAIIEVVIGLTFLWIVLSLVTIQILEWINGTLDKRAQDLEASIHEMLANPNLKAQFYDHPIIRGLTARKRRAPSQIPAGFYRYPIIRGFTRVKRKLPSYIPSRQFALTLFDMAMTAGTESSIIQLGILKLRDDLLEDPKYSANQAIIIELNLLAEIARSAAATEAGTLISQITLDALKTDIARFTQKYPEFQALVAAALEEASQIKSEMDQVLARQPKRADSALSRLRRGLVALGVISPELSLFLNSLLLNIEDYLTPGTTSLGLAREYVEKWFNDSMDRISGVFRRYSYVMALLIGLYLALFLNIDMISFTTYLWRDLAVRQAIETAASVQFQSAGAESDPTQSIQSFEDQFTGLHLPIGWVINQSQYPADCRLFPRAGESFGIPLIGTDTCIATPQSGDETNLLLKLLGLMFTAFAVQQGAPFWFDVLKRFVNLRRTGANPNESENLR